MDSTFRVWKVESGAAKELADSGRIKDGSPLENGWILDCPSTLLFLSSALEPLSSSVAMVEISLHGLATMQSVR